METLYAFLQSQEEIYKKLIILLTIFIIFAFGVYISYILNDRKNYPMYLSEQTFDMWLNNSNLNQVKKSTTIDGVTINEIDSLNSFTDVEFCPKSQCSVNLSTGVKICPSSVNKSSSSGANSAGITYNPGIEVCVDPQKCPPQLPYAVENNGSATNNVCDSEIPCYCTSDPQCATRVSKYFFNEGSGTPGGILQDQLNFSFSTIGVKDENNLYNNLILDVNLLSDQYCELNPAFTDKIIDGCNFENTWNEPLGCEFTNVFSNNSGAYSFVPVDLPETSTVLKNVFTSFSSSPAITKYSTGMNFIGISPSTTIPLITLSDALKNTGSITIGNDTYFFENYVFNGNNIFLHGLYTTVNNKIVRGLINDVTIASSSITLNTETLSNCQNPSNTNVNFKNMLTCVQTYKQPCSEGVLAYNIDVGDPRGFCQGAGLSLVLGEGLPINDFFLINPAFFTMSCVTGAGCDDSIDSSYCSEDNDCTNAFVEKKDKLFPKQDLSALTNLFEVPPSSYGLSYKPIISYIGSGLYNIKNNLMQVENGDYWIVRNTNNNVYLTRNGTAGSSIINVNDTSGIRKGMSVNFSKTYTINTYSGTSIYLNSNIDTLDQSIARAGYELIIYGGDSYYGYVHDVTNYVNHQTFFLYNSTDIKEVDANQIDIANNTITFYKQFGFNGLNYNTNYSILNGTRSFSSSYYYKQSQFRQLLNIEPPFSEYEFFTKNKNSAILNSNSSFAQKYSMYYPVFNENYFRQECVYCSPSLNVYPLIDDSGGGGLIGLNIQFSGKEFYQYGYGNLTGTFKHHYVTFGLTAISKNRISNQSNCSCIVLNKAIEGLKVGDYVIDEEGLLGKQMVNSENVISNPPAGFVMHSNFGTSNIPDDKYLPYNLNGKVFLPNKGMSFSMDASSSNLVPNVFYGKTYFEKGDSNLNQYYIKPLITIVKISDDNKIIITNSPSLMPISEKKVIQFISPSQDIGIKVLQDPQSTGNAIGSGAVLSVDSIADGRIVSLNIDNKGSGYSTANKPVIFISKYSPDTSQFNISN